MTLSDKEFLQQFEAKTLAPEHFDHRGHLRLAWLYLKQLPLKQAEQKICDGINRYATSLGASDKFHYTLTVAITRIMANRIDAGNTTNFDRFLELNPKLQTEMMALVDRHYSPELLHSEQAKREFISPDLQPL